MNIPWFSPEKRASDVARYVGRLLQTEQLETRRLLAGDLTASWQNASNSNDVNQDGLVTSLDALQVIRSINIDGARALPSPGSGEPGGGQSPAPLMIDTNGDGFLSPRDALSIIDELNAHGEGETIRFRLEVTDPAGNPIDTVELGSAFQVRGFIQDLRDGDEAQGVFAAYVDVTYDTNLASVSATDPVTFGSNYPNGKSGNFLDDGLMDEVGAFANATPLGDSEHLLFSVSMQADAVGTLTFASDAADILPAHETLFFGSDDTVDPAEILFGTATVAVADSASPPDLVQFAKDLAAAGVELWSTNQANSDAVSQRVLFEDGANYLPINAFFNTNGGQSSAATAANITEVNTWVFPDSSRATGVLSLQEISDRSGVAIPGATGPALKEIVDGGQLSVEFAAPRHLPLDGYDPFGEPLSYTVAVGDSDLVEASIVNGNRQWALEIEDYGTMVLELFEQRASRATEQFIALTQEGFYDGIIFHRVIPNFVIQGGDPLGTGTGGSLRDDFDDQFHVDLRHNQVGVLSMAKSADDTNNSQFFITHRDTPHLDFNHTVFGQLIEGFDVLDGITTASTDFRDKPLNDIVITRATVFEDIENAVLQVRGLESTGTTTVTVTATDSLGNQTSQEFEVNLQEASTNAQAFLSDIPDFSAVPGTTHQFQLDYTDIEDDDVFFFADPVTADIQSDVTTNGLVSVQIPADAVPGSEILVDVTVSESSAISTFTNFDRQRVLIRVEEAAGAGVDDTFEVDEDTAESALDVLANDGLDDTATIVSVTGEAVNGIATIAAGGKSILYSPAADFFGEATFTYTATTENDGAFSANVTVTVQNVLDPPIARDDVFPEALDEDDPARDLYVEDSAGDIPLTKVLVNDLNADGEEQELTTISGVTDPEFGSITWNAIQIRYTPATDFFGADTFTYTTTGLTSGLSSTGTITVNIAEQNDPPVAVDDTISANAGITNIFLADQLLANDVAGPDNESDQTLRLTALDYQGSGSVQINDEGNIEYLPGAGFVGSETIVYTVEDDGTSRGEDDPQTATATITVNVEPAGIAVDDSFSVDFDSSNNLLDVLANDDSSRGASFVAVTAATNGTASLDGGQITYTPNAGFVGADTFMYTIRDDDGIEASATVFLTVRAEASLAVDDAFTVVGIEALAVLDNDILGSGAASLSIRSVTQPTNGTLAVLENQQIEYRPNSGFLGVDAFTYTLEDDNANTSTATVLVTVEEPPNSPPTATYDVVELVADVETQALNVLDNDTSSPDIDEVLSVEAIEVEPQNGTAAIAANGSDILYTPNAGFTGSDSLRYRISDGRGGTAAAVVDITVAMDAPVAVDDAFTVVSPGVQTYNVLGNDTAPSGRSLRITQVDTDGSSGQVETTADGSRILYTPDFSVVGIDTFAYTIEDDAGQTARATVTVSVPDLISGSFFAGSVFTDQNSNGVREPNERGVGGVTITLEGSDIAGNTVRRETQTTLTGEFRFDGIAPGSYTVTEQQPAFIVGGRNFFDPVEITADELQIQVTEQLIASDQNSFGERGLHPQFALLDALSSSRADGLFVVLEDDELAWAEDRGGWGSIESIAISRNDDLLSVESSGVGSAELSIADRTVQLLGRSGDHTFLRIRGTSSEVLSPASVDQALAQ